MKDAALRIALLTMIAMLSMVFIIEKKEESFDLQDTSSTRC